MRFLLSCFVACCLCACTVKTKDDYAQYLRNNEGVVTYPKQDGNFCYGMTERTRTHHHAVRSWMGGIMNSWEVEFGRVVHATMQSKDVGMAFAAPLKPLVEGASCPDLIMFDLINYDFLENKAKIRLSIRTVLADGRETTKIYYSEGRRQLGKMYWGKGLATKSAIQQSTKLAMDSILTSYFNDLTDFRCR